MPSALQIEPKTHALVAAIIAQSGARWIIETGTHIGEGTEELAKLVPNVDTIEIRADFHAEAAKRIGLNTNVRLHLGSSDELLPEILARHLGGVAFLLLDAHWNDHWPLKNELSQINAERENGFLCTVLIHDMFVPNQHQFAGCFGGGGIVGDPYFGPRTKFDDTPCDYNTFSFELDKFPHFYWPTWPEGGMGFGVASDFQLDLGTEVEQVR